MEALKPLGILVAMLFVIPFVWQGAAAAQDLRGTSGPACIINGDEGQRLRQVVKDRAALYNIQSINAAAEHESTCTIGQTVYATPANPVTWTVAGKEYQQEGNYTGGSPWPDSRWNWPITLTWDSDGMATLKEDGWKGGLYKQYLRLLPLIALFTFLGMTLFAWADR